MVEVNTNITTDGGLFSTGTIRWDSYELETPLKANPVDKLTARDTIDKAIRQIAQVYVEIGPADLEAYRSGNTPKALYDLEQKLAHTIDEEVVVVIVEYTDGHEIDQQDMDTLVEIQIDYADIVTAPCQPELSEPLMTVIEDGRSELDHSPFRALRSSVEHFKEALNRTNLDKPVMGILPLLAPGHQRQVLTLYEDIGIDFLAIDFRGLKPTTDDVYEWLQDFIADLTVRGELTNRVLYALNYRPYFPRRNSNMHPSEGIALIGSGFSILGETHVSRMVIEGDHKVTNTKAFDPSALGFRSVPLDNIEDGWPQNSTIPAARIASAGDSKRRDLRKLCNAESLNYSLRAFRAAVENGDVSGFIQNKEMSDLLLGYTLSMENVYESARGPGVAGD